MDDIKLISEIKNNECIYLRGQMDYRTSDIRKKAWAEISAAVGHEEKYCKARWRTIRNQFVRLYTRNTPTDWKLYPHLAFLKYSILPTPSHATANTTDYTTATAEEASATDALKSEFEQQQVDNEEIMMPGSRSTQRNEATFTTQWCRTPRKRCNYARKCGFRPEDQFLKYFNQLQHTANQKFNTEPREQNRFVELLRNMLDEMPEDNQQYCKMYILNYLHNVVNKM